MFDLSAQDEFMERSKVLREAATWMFSVALALVLGFTLGQQQRVDSRTLYKAIPQPTEQAPMLVRMTATLICAADTDGLKAASETISWQVASRVTEGHFDACQGWRSIGSFDRGYGHTGWVILFRNPSPLGEQAWTVVVNANREAPMVVGIE